MDKYGQRPNNKKGTRKRKRQYRLQPDTLKSLDQFRQSRSMEKGTRVSRDEAITLLVNEEKRKNKKKRPNDNAKEDDVNDEFLQADLERYLRARYRGKWDIVTRVK